MRYNQLTDERILSIDALRGITILVMIFVNELAGVRDIPQWMKHMPRDADAMSFVDVVFPAFLFIVGMAIPFAINRRLAKGENLLQVQQHILFRTLGLLVLGFFLVNTEGGYNEKAMGIGINLWALLFFAAAILIWKVYRTSNKVVLYGLSAIGFIVLITLAVIYKGENGEHITQSSYRIRFLQGIIFILLLFASGYFLRTWFKISKIYTTPTWCLFNAGFCTLLFMFLYWLIDKKRIQKWTYFFKPAASNPLLTYIIPDIIYFLTALLGISLFPVHLKYGMPGILWSAFFAVIVMGIVILLNKMKL